MSAEEWYKVADVEKIPSPSLLVYPDRIAENIRRTIATVGTTDRLRPHVKTHKMPEVIKLQLAAGISKFKAATIAEMEMVADAGGKDILLAYQPVGPNVERLRQLVERFPDVRFGAVVDCEASVDRLNAAFKDAPGKLHVYLDVDCGMHRTGIEPGGRAIDIYRQIGNAANLSVGGIHAYDGHLHDSDLKVRTEKCTMEFALVRTMVEELRAEGMEVPELVAGGTPTFPIHAKSDDVVCSPGTVFLWDYGYGTNIPDMDYLVAAVLLTRVISKPGQNHVCVDLGHKSVAAENPHPRVRFLNLPVEESVSQSEEHLVLRTNTDDLEVGDVLYGVPKHVCPSVALHSRAHTIEDGQLSGEWQVVARERKLTI
ncbi:MAG: D-TA family PLP-dependent enzyme [Verrucomicrobiia bacterium]|jgi:D-serine deaminase-like pyridoxal phosphate-dependent protein